MKYILTLLFFISYFHSLMPHAYVDTLDTILQQKTSKTDEPISLLQQVIHEIDTALKDKISLHDLYNLLNSAQFSSLFTLDVSPSMQEVKFVLGAKIYLYCLDCCEKKMLHKASKNKESLDYWQTELFYENRSLFQQNINYWLCHDDYTKTIQDNIVNLESISQQTFYFLGLVRYNKKKLLEASNQNIFEKNLMKAVRLQDIFLNAPHRDYDYCDIYGVITLMAQQSDNFCKILSLQYIQSQPPHRLERNWVACTSTAVGLCACVIAYSMYKEQIDSFAVNTYQAGESFWDTKIKRPAIKMINIVSGSEKDPLVDTQREQIIYHGLLVQGDQAPTPRGGEVTDVEVIIDESSKIVGQVTSYAVKATGSINVWSWLGYKQQQGTQGIMIPPSNIEINQQLYDRMSLEQREALRLRVAVKDITILKYPKANLNEVVPALERSVFGPIVELQKAMNTLYEENRLTIGMVAMFPVMSLAGGAFFASKKAYYTSVYEPILKIFRDLEIFLNDVSDKSISFDKEGHLYFLTELLKKKCEILTLKDLTFMEQDIAELQSKKLTYAQKFNTLQRMYRTYNFLLPGAI